ncbi:copper resistance protein CopC [Arthrobacter sp. YJM1]|uniref:Copper resistance protein CopC n=1 Tax=Arthrobacter horti TaxID=3068273 RepID=A0ABT9ILE7_9MICC|nr:copper resistance CopC family protein [Arthrobacter sp. YJM1]MDP5226401.1 copper resistance protein CopC [Arthrobacter sp. YJM1]
MTQPTTTAGRRPRRNPRATVLAAVVAVFSAALLVLGLAAPASAHDVLEGTTPKDGATAAAAPDKVTLTFSNNPIGIGSEVLVKDPSGTNWSNGPVDIVDNVVTQKLKDGAPAGKYTVQWRVVSSDSHPIEGTFSYTVTSGAQVPGVASAAPLSSPSAEPAQAAAPGEPFPVMIVVFAVLAVILLVIVGVLARRKLGGSSED